MESIIVPATVTSLGGNVFHNAKIRNIKIEAPITVLPQGLFMGTEADVVDLPAGITGIEERAFGGGHTIAGTHKDVETSPDCKIGALIVRAETPPILKPSTNGQSLPRATNEAIGAIYVPDGSVDAYKASDGGVPTKQNWKKYGDAGKIKPLSEYTE
jgi:hypothetical protein